MKTSLPTVKKITAKGFTLVELMVVIAIIAVLATVALTLFQNSQQGARNARRQADLQAIANALETHYNPTTAAGCAAGVAATYCSLNPNWFSAQAIPLDPVSTATYCAAFSTTVGANTPVNMVGNATGTCTAGVPGYAALSNTNPANASTTWKVCAQIEPFSATDTLYCVSNQQS